MKRVHVFYTGNVQGVGFRFAAERLAIDYDIKGWVKNLPGGRVEIIAEQKEDVLKGFLQQIQKIFSRYIQDTDIDWQETMGEYKDFSIKF